jgi:GNAT superfamily N-acetyltransferase
MDTRLQAKVRRATLADARALAELRFAFRASLAEPVESEQSFIDRCAAWMESRLAEHGRWRVWLLETETAVVGTVWLQLIEKLPNPVLERELHAYLTNFYVHPEHRGHGGGAALLAALLAECESLRVDSIFLWPTRQSRPLYERHGFTGESRVMVRVQLAP